MNAAASCGLVVLADMNEHQERGRGCWNKRRVGNIVLVFDLD
jgi:hypothetical protein